MTEPPTIPSVHELDAAATGPGPQPPAAGAPAGEDSVRPLYAVAVTVAVTFSVVAALILQTSPTLSPNDTSRWNAVWAMLETGRCSWVGNGPWWTIDRCTYDPADTKEQILRARWYSSKPYFMQVLLAGVAWPICRLAHLDVKEHLNIVGRAVLILFNAVPLAIFLAFFGRWLVRLRTGGFAFAYSLIAAAAGTYLTAYCITLNNHVPAAICAFFSLYALFGISTRGAEASWGWFAMAGFFGGMAAAFDAPATAIFGLGFAYVVLLFVRQRRSTSRNAWAPAAFVPAALVPVCGYFLSNYLCTGQWLSFQWRFPQHYDPYWRNPTGLDALHEPKGFYLLQQTFGHHGFFSLTPIFLVSLVGFVRNLRDRQLGLRPIAALSALSSLAVFAFVTWKTHNYGGTCQGSRWLFWLIPMWLIMLPAGVEWIARRPLGRWVAVLLLAVSAFSMAYASRMPWSRSWLHELYAAAGIINY